MFMPKETHLCVGQPMFVSQKPHPPGCVKYVFFPQPHMWRTSGMFTVMEPYACYTRHMSRKPGHMPALPEGYAHHAKHTLQNLAYPPSFPEHYYQNLPYPSRQPWHTPGPPGVCSCSLKHYPGSAGVWLGIPDIPRLCHGYILCNETIYRDCHKLCLHYK